jgi:hypothetical protein
MSQPQKDDKVRATLVGLFDHYDSPTDSWCIRSADPLAPDRGVKVPASFFEATVEVVESADDPSKDPVGTVRDGAPGHNAWVKAGPGRWLLVGGIPIEKTDEEMTFGEHSVIGAMPGVHPEKL